MTDHPPRGQPAPRDGGKGGGVAIGFASGVLLTIAGFFVVVSLEGDLFLLPLGLAALPVVVGVVLLATGRRRDFGLGMVIGAGVLLVVDTVACFSLLSGS